MVGTDTVATDSDRRLSNAAPVTSYTLAMPPFAWLLSIALALCAPASTSRSNAASSNAAPPSKAASRSNTASSNEASPSKAASPSSTSNEAHRASSRTTSTSRTSSTPLAPPSTTGWATVLRTYTTTDGGFRYAALHAHVEHRALLDAYVAAIAAADPSRWTRDEQLAFYLDAYNALTVHAVITRWPLRSVMDVPGFFERIEHRVAGRAMTLNHLENEVIRPTFSEPRIHFAVNCASASCPPLHREPFTGQRDLNATVDQLTRAFVRRTTRVTNDGVRVSKLFEWFAADFEPRGGVRAFVASYLDDAKAAQVRDEARTMTYARYDWATNARE